MEDLHSYRILELARASCDSFHAKERYKRLCLCEIKILRSIAVDEYEEASSLRKSAEGQIGEVRHLQSLRGSTLLNTQFRHTAATVANSDDMSSSSVGSCSPSPVAS